MQLFYTPLITEDDEVLTLSKDESHHAAKVLRIKEGDEIHTTNGQGLMVRAVVELASPSMLKVKVVERIDDFQRRDYKIHVAIAPTKMNERMEWFLEKAPK